MSGTNNSDKKYFLGTFWYNVKFSLFLLGPCLSIFCQKFNFPKIVFNCGEELPLISGNNNFDKKYFLSTFWYKTNFSSFCKVHACRYYLKNSIFQKLPKIVEKHFLWWVEQIILTKDIFFAHFEIIKIFHHLPKSRACRYSVKNSIFQKLPKVVEKHFLWWVEQIILTKIIF